MSNGDALLIDKVFQAFLKDLEAAQVDEAVRDRLRNALLVDRKFSDAALQDALFGDADPLK